MKVWIEQCKQANNSRLSWYGVSSLFKEAQHTRDINIRKREIDLAYGLKDYQENIFTHTKFFYNYIDAVYGMFFS